MLGDRIKELRTKKNITQEQLAVDLNVAKSTIGMWENNRREPDLETINKIAAYFRVPTDYLASNAISCLPLRHHKSSFPSNNAPCCHAFLDIKKRPPAVIQTVLSCKIRDVGK